MFRLTPPDFGGVFIFAGVADGGNGGRAAPQSSPAPVSFRFPIAERPQDLRKCVTEIHPVHVGVCTAGCAWRNIPRSSGQVRILENHRERTVAFTLPDGGHQAKGRFLQSPVIGAGGAREAVANPCWSLAGSINRNIAGYIDGAVVAIKQYVSRKLGFKAVDC